MIGNWTIQCDYKYTIKANPDMRPSLHRGTYDDHDPEPLPMRQEHP